MALLPWFESPRTGIVARLGGSKYSNKAASRPLATTYTVRLRVTTSSGYGVSLALKNAAGTVLANINVPGTGSNQQYTTLFWRRAVAVYWRLTPSSAGLLLICALLEISS